MWDLGHIYSLCLAQISIVTDSESSHRAWSSPWSVNISWKMPKNNCHSNVSLAPINCQFKGDTEAACLKLTGSRAYCVPARGGPQVLEWGLQEEIAVWFRAPTVILLSEDTPVSEFLSCWRRAWISLLGKTQCCVTMLSCSCKTGNGGKLLGLELCLNLRQ